MDSNNNSRKMFSEIVKQLRQLIHDEKIPVGGKLPSERELAERLQVGRSSVREALRSLELLGLIETRRGEGTFLSDYRKHQLVELLSTFILPESKSKEDVHTTRASLEKDAIRQVCHSDKLHKLLIWDAFIEKLLKEEVLREEIIREILIISNNRLGLKIWFLLKQYGGEPYRSYMTIEEKGIWTLLLECIKLGDEQKGISLFEDWLLLLNRGDV